MTRCKVCGWDIVEIRVDGGKLIRKYYAECKRCRNRTKSKMLRSFALREWGKINDAGRNA